MEWPIETYQSAGLVRFGMTRAEVRARLALPASPFRKSQGDSVPADAFDAVGVHVFYDDDARVEAVEFFGGGAEPVLDGLQLLSMPYRELEAGLAARDPDLLRQIDGSLSLLCGIGVSADPERAGQGARSAIAFRRGYYDASRADLETLARK